MNKAKDLREMSDEQLVLTLKDAAENLFRLRLQAETERLDAPSELLKQRRLIARVKTVQTERVNVQKKAEAKAAAPAPAPPKPKAEKPKAEAKPKAEGKGKAEGKAKPEKAKKQEAKK
jgi:large subunit ribosomal protein L29